jgi:hypothetical protein
MVNPVLMEKLSKYENQQRERQRATIQRITEIDDAGVINRSSVL